MPYIKSEDRMKFDEKLTNFPELKTKGEFEYVIYSLMQRYMYNKKRNYSNLHDCVYAVQHCSDEFRRRHLDAREDNAREENGDII